MECDPAHSSWFGIGVFRCKYDICLSLDSATSEKWAYRVASVASCRRNN